MRKIKALFASAAVLAVTAPSAFAADGTVDYTAMLDKFDAVGITTGIVAICTAVVGVVAVGKGGGMLVSFLRRT